MMKYSLSLLSWAAMGLLICGSVTGEPCNLCLNGEPISLPEKKLDIEGLPVHDCQGLLDATTFLQDGSLYCDAIHQISTLCGCGYDQDLSSSCALCPDGSPVPRPLAKVPGYMGSDLIPGTPTGVNLNCETLEAILHQSHPDSDMCLDAQAVSFHCGCPGVVPTGNEQPSGDYNNTHTETIVPDEDDREACSVCLDGGEVTLPDKEFVMEGLPLETCKDLISSAAFLEQGSGECESLQLVGSFCGCTYVRHEYTLCPNGEPLPFPDKQIDWLDTYVVGDSIPDDYARMAGSISCGLLEASLQNLPDNFFGITTKFVHLTSQFKSGACGCHHDWHAQLMIWCYRISGSLSGIGSLIIIFDVLLYKTKRRHTYHQLVFGMSCFDLLSSVAYAFATVMAPSNSGLYQATGNEVSCSIQGFMIELGLTSVLFNAMLATYFLLVNNYNWKERAFRKIRTRVYIVTVTIGLAMAVAGLWFYGEHTGICYVKVPPVAESWVPISLLHTLPVGFSLLTATVASLQICRKVYSVELKSLRWSVRQDAVLSKRVFLQTFWYLMSFYVTLPVATLGYYLAGRTGWDGYSVFLLSSILIPLQGALNATVYCCRQRTFLSPWVKYLKSCLWCCREPRSDKTFPKAKQSFLMDSTPDCAPDHDEECGAPDSNVKSLSGAPVWSTVVAAPKRKISVPRPRQSVTAIEEFVHLMDQIRDEVPDVSLAVLHTNTTKSDRDLGTPAEQESLPIRYVKSIQDFRTPAMRHATWSQEFWVPEEETVGTGASGRSRSMDMAHSAIFF